ncbi:response regulator [Prevotella sp. A2931]|uniref:histidine kinase n=1 Tax=Prevotella illustrans TaxID=2800387 RepID=A0ABS3M3Y4_9BACT|nr:MULTISPECIES: two-component regulator propeller domain-containing protein [Prevotella]MBO1362864.1 response regulator [Prevotella illustrans]PTL25930.1 hybrid sensor histidine kinase/response regulator [Prevotella sp. oral taxon 820]
MKISSHSFRDSLFFVCFLTLLYACRSQHQQDDRKKKRNPLIADNISNHHINAFAEDGKGHVWIATFRGLNKFDGHQYQQYFCNDDSMGLPDNQVRDLLVDRQNRLWVACLNGVCRRTDQDNFVRIPFGGEAGNCNNLAQDSRGRIFICNSCGVMVFNAERQCFEMVIDANRVKGAFMRLVIDKNDNLWVAAESGLYGFDGDFRNIAFERLSFYSSDSNVHYLDDSGILWLCLRQGIALYNTRARRLEQLPSVLRTNIDISRSRTLCVYPYDVAGILISTGAGKTYLYHRRKDTLIAPDSPDFPVKVGRFWPTCMFRDSRDNLWMGSTDEGYIVNYRDHKLFNSNSHLHDYIGQQPVLSLATDGQRHLWVLAKHSGLVHYDIQTKKASPVNLLSLHDDSPYFLFADRQDNLWITTGKGVLKCKVNGSSVSVVREYPGGLQLDMTQDGHGDVWSVGLGNRVTRYDSGSAAFDRLTVGTALFSPAILTQSDGRVLVAGFMGDIKAICPDDMAVTDFPIDREDMKKCMRRPTFIPTDLYQDMEGLIWIGTDSNGLLRYNPRTRQLDAIDGISCSDVAAIIEDNQGNLWVSTMYGLNKYDRTVNKVTQFYVSDGIGGNQFYDRAACRLADGTLVFGGTHGITTFNPIDITTRRNLPLVFETLKVHNRQVHAYSDECIDKSMDNNPEIRLSHDQNSFSISYAAIDYSEYERVHYFYKLEGIDSYWNDAGTSHEASYANLPAGRYTFRVKVANNDREKPISENAIEIHVAPMPLNSWWAWLVYIVLAAVILRFTLRIRRRIEADKRAVRQEKMEKEQEQRVNRMNMSFFANISHEFRTPLTMIAGPIDMLGESAGLKDDDRHLLLIVRHSIQRMLRLVNQVMDFSKLDQDALKLNVRRMDVTALMNRICDIFLFNAHEKGINMQKHGLDDCLLTWVDADKLDKIVSNLLSNAMKFTPQGGQIDVTLDVDDGFVKIVVADTGKGIPSGELENIFRRFYQLDNQATGTLNWGTGIGLYYARKLAQLHHGSLTAGNRDGGHGAVFTLLLPVDDRAYTEDERKVQTEVQEKRYPIDARRPVIVDDAGDEKAQILVVDDDTDVVNYLQTLLSPHYRIIYRFDAESAFKALGEENPSLVLSDVVMPGMDGYEFCRRVKTDAQLCHIPVVLVTAKTTVEDQIEGLDTGADAYVTKPFEPKLLLALIKSQLQNRKKIHALLNRSTQTGTDVEEALAPQDRRFMKELYEVMESELSNSDIDITRVTEMMHMSRTKFYYKMKGLTGEKPAVFFRTYKLNRAAELLREGTYNISEISDMTGFSSLSYFSTAFKRQFGVTPSEYK